MTRQHRRARLVTGAPEPDGISTWEHVEPEPKIPIPLPLHWWSNWKGLARQDWLLRDTRLVRITDQATKDWAEAFVNRHATFMPCNDECLLCFEYRDAVASEERDLWDVMEERMERSDPKTAYQIAAGMAMEMHAAMPHHERNYEFKMQTAFKDRIYYVYTHWFGSPEHPRSEVFLR